MGNLIEVSRLMAGSISTPNKSFYFENIVIAFNLDVTLHLQYITLV
jgi:hypothetical protein